MSDLSAADRAAIDDLFRNPPRAPSAVRDAFRYRLSRGEGSAAQTIEVPEAAVPAIVAATVKDTFV